MERIDGRSVVGFDVGIGSASDVLIHNSNKKIADTGVDVVDDDGVVPVFEMKKTQSQTKPKKITLEGEVALAVTVADKKLVPKKRHKRKNQKR